MPDSTYLMWRSCLPVTLILYCAATSPASVTTPDEKTPIASHASRLCSKIELVTPQMNESPGRASKMASGCESGTYGEMVSVKPCSGATSSGAARQQLPTAFAGWPEKMTRSCRMTAHQSSIVSSRKRCTSSSSDAPAKWSFGSVGMSTSYCVPQSERWSELLLLSPLSESTSVCSRLASGASSMCRRSASRSSGR